MKQLKCEACGSMDLVERDGYYVCKFCDTKYTLEEAAKLVEGTVTIDNCERLANLYVAARRAKDMNSYSQAASYYREILALDPQNWEPTFYSVFCEAMDIKVYQIDNTWKKLQECFSLVLAVMCREYNEDRMSKNTLIRAMSEVEASIIGFTKSVYSTCQQNFSRGWQNGSVSSSGVEEHGVRMLLIVLGLVGMGKQIAQGFHQIIGIPESETCLLATPLCKEAVSLANNYCTEMQRLTGKELSDLSMTMSKNVKEAIEIIRKGDPSYIAPRIGGNIQGSNISSSSNSSSGCYIATCVYGSYDCPQVWTLRRYRDYTLTETWYGRAFVRTYYAISPTLVKLFGHTEWFKKMWKGKLDRMVADLNAEGVEGTPYEDKVW